MLYGLLACEIEPADDLSNAVSNYMLNSKQEDKNRKLEKEMLKPAIGFPSDSLTSPNSNSKTREKKKRNTKRKFISSRLLFSPCSLPYHRLRKPAEGFYVRVSRSPPLPATSPITTQPSRKLDYKFYGPFEVEAPVGKQAYRLKLPKSMKIHDVFHVSLLEPCRQSSAGDAQSLPIEVEGEEQYEVEEILEKESIMGNCSIWSSRWVTPTLITRG